jgi:fructosamine-3-kinase
MLPDPLYEAVAASLRAAGDTTPIQQTRPLGGGCINNALRLETERQSYLLKWHPDPLPEMFVTEERGLELLASANAVRVPAVLHATNASGEQPAYILMEWLEGSVSTHDAQAQATLGQQLAALHRSSADAYGLDTDNYIGTTPQYNGWDADWIAFFGERRLRPQIELAARNGYLPAHRRRPLERVLERLPDWLGGVARQPALLHGDLWGGNIIPGPDGNLALIDPAVYYGDREAEIAYTQLFGGFSPHFYSGYQDAWPLEAGYDERRDLYNLYHLLNHLNIFGTSYASSVERIAQHYAG